MTHPCGHETRHGQRIGCCSHCRRLFSSDTAFEKHALIGGGCVNPEAVGLVARPSKTHPDETIWTSPPPAERITRRSTA